MTLEILVLARMEVAEAIAYYEEAEAGLGVRFRREIEGAITDILSGPLLRRQRPGGYRRVNLPGFPFYVAYIVRGERVRVIAVSHSARQPDYFRSRLR